MPEEKQENKKPGIIRQIFKWFGLGLLTLLIVLALFFQAPWKVITLLVIIFLACTALPRPLRKWFWLTVGTVAIALVIWAFLPDGNGDWRPYTFDEELAAIEAKRAIPDSENAAIIYNQLLENYDRDDFEPNLPDPNVYYLTRSEPWSSKDHPEIAQWLRGHQSTIATLMRASKKEKCRFPINADLVSFSNTMDRLSPMRRWTYLLISAANNDIAEGQIDAGLEKCIALLQMAKHQYQQPTIINMLVGMGIEALALRQFNRFVVTSEPTEAQLSAIDEALAGIKHDWGSDLPRMLECEKLIAKNLWGMFYGVNREGKIKLTRGLTSTIMAQLPEDMKDELVITYWHKRLMKVWTIFCWFYMPSSPQRVGEIIDDSFEVLYEMAEPDFNWQKKPEGPRKLSLKLNCYFTIKRLVHIMEPAYYRLHDLSLRLLTDKRGSQLIIALRRHKNKSGVWPESLDDIKSLAPAEIFTDPINDGEFVYKLT